MLLRYPAITTSPELRALADHAACARDGETVHIYGDIRVEAKARVLWKHPNSK